MQTTGSKYDISRDIKDVAKLVRKDLKVAMPGTKWSVTISRYSMGQSIQMSLKSIKGVDIVDLVARITDDYGTRVVRTAAVHELTERAVGLAHAYNRRDIDSQSDLYNVSFSASASLCWGVEAQARVAYAEQAEPVEGEQARFIRELVA